MQVCYPVDMKKAKRRSGCPINFALEIFGDKWTLLVVRDLLLSGKTYYGDFLKSQEKIATNILADRLEIMECAGIVRKAQDQNNKKKYLYTLTKKGVDLLPVLIEIIMWSAKYDPKTAAPKEFILQAQRDKKGLIRSLMKGFK